MGSAETTSERLDAGCRVALAALLHDLGKFAERGRVFAGDARLADQEAMVCPHQVSGSGGTFGHTHKHAAHTGLALDFLEAKGLLPPMVGQDMRPFGSWGRPGETDDSLANAAAMHHRPETFLQWVVASADRAASGFERNNFEDYNKADEKGDHYRARLLTQFEQLDLAGGKSGPDRCKHAYPLAAMSPAAIIPKPRADLEPGRTAAQAEYANLWRQFVEGLTQIPAAHKQSLPLWLDHFDSLWLCFTQAIPSATAGNTAPDVSLYDHTKAVAALATAIWRYHADQGHEPAIVTADLRRSDRGGTYGWADTKILLIQGDFFGIQNFLFASGGSTNKNRAKILRGRSFQVAMLCELAALRVLEALDLPPTSQVLNAAGKFLIVAPNTPEALTQIAAVRSELDQWFLQHTFGQQGVGLAWTASSLDDFASKKFRAALDRLGESLEVAKLQRFGLVGAPAPAAVFTDYLDATAEFGVCAYDGKSPAADTDSDGRPISWLAKDQIAIGKALVSESRLVVARRRDGRHGALGLDYFGYGLRFTGDAIAGGLPVRTWDFAGPSDANAPLFSGLARRWVNTYVPRSANDEVMPFDEIANADRRADGAGLAALGVVKGDVDNLGALFHTGLQQPSFAKWAGLSRQLHFFFAVHLPWLCETEFRNMYTVFAGGDDFFLVGPWHSALDLVARMRADFADYVRNPGITFSAGVAVLGVQVPLPRMADAAEDLLAAAKAHDADGRKKDAVTVFGRTMGWERAREQLQAAQNIAEFLDAHHVSTGVRIHHPAPSLGAEHRA